MSFFSWSPILSPPRVKNPNPPLDTEQIFVFVYKCVSVEGCVRIFIPDLVFYAPIPNLFGPFSPNGFVWLPLAEPIRRWRGCIISIHDLQPTRYYKVMMPIIIGCYFYSCDASTMPTSGFAVIPLAASKVPWRIGIRPKEVRVFRFYSRQSHFSKCFKSWRYNGWRKLPWQFWSWVICRSLFCICASPKILSDFLFPPFQVYLFASSIYFPNVVRNKHAHCNEAAEYSGLEILLKTF